MSNIDLKLLLGQDIELSCGIILSIPTLKQIVDIGEQNYYGMVNLITSTPADLNWQLWDAGIDYTEITEFALFCSIILANMQKYPIDMIFKNEDFLNYVPIYDETLKDFSMLKNTKTGRVITLTDFEEITDILRKIHDFKKNSKYPANQATKLFMIEIARQDYEKSIIESKFKEQKNEKSTLYNLISAMVNSSGFKYSYDTVWDLKLNHFMDSVKRISKIRQSNLLLQSGYSGFGISLKDIDKKEIDWLGSIS